MNVLRVLFRAATACQPHILVAGFLAGCIVIATAAPVRLAYGIGHVTDGAILLSVCLTMLALSHRLPAWTFSGWLSTLVLSLTAVWTLLIPQLLACAKLLLGRVPLSTLENPVVAFGVVSAVTATCLVPVVLGVSWTFAKSSSLGAAAMRLWVAGVCLAFLIVPAAVAPTIGMAWLAGGVILLSPLWLVVDWLYGRRGKPVIRGNVVSLGRPGGSEEGGRSVLSATSGVADAIVALLTGAGLATVICLSSQWLPRSLAGDCFLCAGVILGLGFFRFIPAADRRSRARSSIGATLLLAAWLALVVALDPMWTSLCLRMNAFISSLAMLYALRAGLFMLVMMPAGIVLARLRDNSPTTRPALNLVAPWTFVALTAGYLSATACGLSAQSVSLILIAAALVVAAVVWISHARQLPIFDRRSLVPGGLALIAALGLALHGNLRPSRTEKALFSSQSLDSFRLGTTAAQLPWLDDGRLVAEFDALDSRVSLWKHRGSQFLIRRNGLPAELHTPDPGLAPRSPADLLPVLLPLTLHPSADHVLVLGVHTPTLQVCQSWPLHSVTTLEGERASRRALDWLLSRKPSLLNLAGGPDFRFRRVGAELGLAAQHELRYDVIVCPQVQPLSVTAASQSTQEFYRSVAAHLAEGGLFAQRIPYYDLGPEVIRSISSTMQSVFAQVLVVESVPGELVYVCSQDALPPVGADFVERLQAPQCRALLGQAGWDWSVVLGRGGLTPESLQQFVGSNSRPNSAADARLAFRFPIEVSRWGAKSEATRAALAQYGTALRGRLGDSPDADVVNQRLEDMTLAHRLQTDHPDEPWAYRAALRDRLKDRPRSTIMQVKHELKRVADPEDQRRKEFLVALGQVATRSQPPLNDVHELSEFETPFDPLLSLFVHYEAAHLLARSDSPAPEEELRHLLHTVYFASTQDRSIRNVCLAISVVCDHPDLIQPDPDGWDQLNGLLQILTVRWQSRINDSRMSKYESADIEISLIASERALQLLESTHASAGLTSAEWSERREVLENSLIRPLQRHRSRNIGRLTSAATSE